MNKTKLNSKKPDCFESLVISKKNIRYELNESEQKENEKLSKKILAVIEGQMIIIGGKSRNGRVYQESPVNFWEYVLKNEEVQRRFKDGQVLGRLGHYTGAVTEEQMQDGLVSHRLVELIPSEKNGIKGYGKIYVLDTEAGRNTLVFLESGTVLYVSTRGEGSYRDPVNKIVDWEDFEFETIDFVLNPGFFEAKPTISKINEELELEIKVEEKKMDKEFLEKLEKITESKETLVRENASLTITNQNLLKEKTDLTEEVKKVRVVLATYEALDKDPQELKKTMKEATTIFEKLSNLGTPESITEQLKKQNETIQKYALLGTPEKIEEALKNQDSIIKSYKKLGEVDSIEKALKNQESIIESYRTKVKTLKASSSSKDITANALVLSEEFDITAENAVKMLNKMSLTEAKEVLENAKGKDNKFNFSENYKPELKTPSTPSTETGKNWRSMFEGKGTSSVDAVFAKAFG
jgi:hypothetical protein